jgi:hypothetical protein
MFVRQLIDPSLTITVSQLPDKEKVIYGNPEVQNVFLPDACSLPFGFFSLYQFRPGHDEYRRFAHSRQRPEDEDQRRRNAT